MNYGQRVFLRRKEYPIPIVHAFLKKLKYGTQNVYEWMNVFFFMLDGGLLYLLLLYPLGKCTVVLLFYVVCSVS